MKYFFSTNGYTKLTKEKEVRFMEKIIAFHCAPALAGIKAANLVSCHKSKFGDVSGNVERLNAQMNRKNIFFEIMRECERGTLVLVYRKEVLQRTLTEKGIYRFLRSFGYPQNVIVDVYLEFLKTRMRNREFPHEIGAFLGYPLHDIHGFLYHKNYGCILSGDWKVYKDADNAQRLFERFAACRKAVVKKLNEGQSLAQIFCAA